jgi:hypothetical protein
MRVDDRRHRQDTSYHDSPADSKIVAGKTKNIFVDTTATDKTKL